MPDEQVIAAEQRTLTVGTQQFSYRSSGQGAPLVLLHGIGSNAGSWNAQLSGLAADRQVYAWDAPGYGTSTPLANERPAANDYAAALIAFLDALEIERCDILGHSLGALMAARFTALHPDRVDRLILASCACGYGTTADGPFPDTIQSRFDDINTLGPAGLADKRSANLLSEDGREAFLDNVRDAMGQVTSIGYRQATYLLAQGDIHLDAVNITRPTLVLCGREDRITPETVVRPVAEELPGAIYRSIAGGGHAVYVEQAAAFNDAVLEFLAPA